MRQKGIVFAALVTVVMIAVASPSGAASLTDQARVAEHAGQLTQQKRKEAP